MPANPIDPINSGDRPSTVDPTEIAGTESPTGPAAGGFGPGAGGGARGLVDDLVGSGDPTDVGAQERRSQLTESMDSRSTAQQAVDAMGTMTERDPDAMVETVQRNAMRDRREAYERQLAECEAANAAGEPYYWGDEMHGDEVLSKVTLSDGTTVWVIPASDPPEVVDVEWAADAEFLYQGDYLSGGESYQVIELPTGHQILVDEHGVSAGLLEDMPPDHLTYPDHRNGGELVEVYLVPAGPPSWDTLVYDATTDELIIQLDTGTTDRSGADLWLLAGNEDIDPTQVYSTYNPPGAEYVLVIDAQGNVVDSYVPPPEQVWGILGIVEYYDDGEVRVDFGPLEVSVDVEGEDGGISISGDVLAFVAPLTEIVPAMEGVGDVSLGVAWEDGDVSVWGEVSGGDYGDFGMGLEVEGLADFVSDAMGGEIDVSSLGGVGVEYTADLEVGDYGLGASLAFGVNNEGNLFVDTDAMVTMQLGIATLETEFNFYAEVGDRLELTGGYRGELNVFGFYLEKSEQFSAVFDDGLLTATYQTYLGAGHELFGGVRAGFEAQVETDGTRGGTSGTAGVYGSVVDEDGEELFRRGEYVDTDVNGRLGAYGDDVGIDTKVTKNTEVFDRDEVPLPSGRLADETPDEIVPDDVFGDGAARPFGGARPGQPRTSGERADATPDRGGLDVDRFGVDGRGPGSAGRPAATVGRPDRDVVFEPNDEPGGPDDVPGPGFEPITLERGVVSGERARPEAGFRGQPDPEERSATGGPVRDGQRARDGLGDGGDLPPSAPVPHDRVTDGIAADDITAPAPMGAPGGDIGGPRDRVDRVASDRGPLREAEDDITGPPAGARLPVDRPSDDSPPSEDSFELDAVVLSEQGGAIGVEASAESVAPVLEVTVEVVPTDDGGGSFDPDPNGGIDDVIDGLPESDGPRFGDQLDQPGS